MLGWQGEQEQLKRDVLLVHIEQARPEAGREQVQNLCAGQFKSSALRTCQHSSTRSPVSSCMLSCAAACKIAISLRVQSSWQPRCLRCSQLFMHRNGMRTNVLWAIVRHSS
jgi:hypothetical protein